MLVPFDPGTGTFPLQVYDTHNRKRESRTLDFEVIGKVFAFGIINKYVDDVA